MTIQLNAAQRADQGTGASRRLRRAGQVPAVVYGAGQDAQAVSVDHNTVFYALRDEKFHTSILELNIDGTAQQVVLRDFQMHPFKQQVQHIDFQRVDLATPIALRVPVHFKNAEISQAVKLQGSKVRYTANSVEVVALPAQLPNAIEVDLSGAKAGSSVHLSDLQLPEGVELVSLQSGKNLSLVTFSGKSAE